MGYFLTAPAYLLVEKLQEKTPIRATIKNSYSNLSNLNILVTKKSENKVVKVWTLV